MRIPVVDKHTTSYEADKKDKKGAAATAAAKKSSEEV